ncbi:phosphate ABC transporter substrate-binding protein (PhoT family) [Acidovorax sp. 107]|uniref:phosphate ABC transporter substrate-binding protein PstS n=1 Tax=Acidovorax sp. 107 TaxID=2135638 RepID=UPI000D363A0A|nr:phosphate ABC transporter substrate-binding protein PstS [Acidovorax sp. 107]PUA96235.1 phosphate ABC transporter substrate-binding protein (PhoT family) [Acidovorax sp. 107]
MKYIYSIFLLAASLWHAIPASAQAVTGAGSSAAAPIYRSWAKAYAKATGSAVDYDPVGSSAGMKKIQQQAVGFGATDVYPADKDLIEQGLLALPVAITGISPIVNLPKVQNAQLRLTGEVLSRIFMGEIGRWNAPEITALNPDISLPDLPIKVVVRADGSGTTYNFADYLGKVSPKWKTSYGAKTSIAWPAGVLAFKGSDGVAKGVRDTVGAIGYVDHGYVAEYGLTSVQMKNADGVYVKPSIDAFKAALANSDWAATGVFNSTLTQRPGKSVWPITMGTFVVFPKVTQNPDQTAQALRFILWSFLNGDTLVQENNFVRLPDRVQASAFKIITSIRDNQGKPLGMSLISSFNRPI